MCAALMTSQLGEILLMHALKEYTTPEQLQILDSMATIAETLTRLELYGLQKLSEKQYQVYLEYLDLLDKQNIKLQEAYNANK